VSQASIAVVTSKDPRYVDPEVPVVAEALRAAGMSPHVVSWDDELDWAAYALVVVRSPWDYFDRVVEFYEWAARVQLVTRIVNPADVIRWNSHKGYLVELAAKGIPTVPTRLIPGESIDVDLQLEECPWDEVVIKPAVDGGGREVLRARRDSDVARLHAEALSAKGDVIVQPFVPGIVDGERSLVFLGGAFSHAVRKVPAEGDYRVQYFYGGTELEHAPDSAELHVALWAIDSAPGRLTYARVDLVDWEGAPTLMELEAIEPDLYLRDTPERLARFAAAIQAELEMPSNEGAPA
jgi:glutathione synthase/RimK-type ligase-like ATP-grasp enzyme